MKPQPHDQRKSFKMSRSEQHMQGYRRATKDAIEWLHHRALEMNDPHAQQILNSAAFSLGGAANRHGLIPTKHPRSAPPPSILPEVRG